MKYLLPTDVFLRLMNQASAPRPDEEAAGFCRKNYRSFTSLFIPRVRITHRRRSSPQAQRLLQSDGPS